jgi:hypothetical protein
MLEEEALASSWKSLRLVSVRSAALHVSCATCHGWRRLFVGHHQLMVMQTLALYEMTATTSDSKLMGNGSNDGRYGHSDKTLPCRSPAGHAACMLTVEAAKFEMPPGYKLGMSWNDTAADHIAPTMHDDGSIR